MLFGNTIKSFKFHKMHGLGNDFVIVFNDKKFFDPTNIIQLSHRKYGIGCDQFIIVEEINKHTARIHFYNNDGSYASACGNGTRCVAWLLHNKFGYSEDIELFIDKNIIKAVCYSKDEVMLELYDYSFTTPKNIEDKLAPLNIVNRKFGLPDHCYANISNQHLIYYVSDLSLYDICAIGQEIQHIISGSINVTIATCISANQLDIKTYERGAGLTEACGSAATVCGAYYLTHLTDKKTMLKEVIVKMSGGSLKIGVNEKFITMRGKTAYIYSGECFI